MPSESRIDRRVSSHFRNRGVSLFGLLSVTCVFAVLSAIVFPRFATPANQATLGIIESVANAEAVNLFTHARAVRHAKLISQPSPKTTRN